MTVKGALHIHSNISPDAELSLAEIKSIFKSRGFSFVLLAEHAENLDADKYARIKQGCVELSDDAFLMLPGIEIKWQEKAHLLAYGAKEYMPNENSLGITETIAAIRKNTNCDFLAWGHINHPLKLEKNMLKALNLVDGIEVSNAGYHGLYCPDFSGLKLLNSLRKTNPGIIGINGLDMHNTKRPAKAYCIIENLNALSSREIFNSFKTGKALFKNICFSLTPGYYNRQALIICFISGVCLDYYRRLKNKLAKKELLWSQ